MRFKTFLASFLNDESGQAVTEYILLLSLSLASAVALSKAILTALDKFTAVFGGQLEKDLKTGGTVYTIWSN